MPKKDPVAQSKYMKEYRERPTSKVAALARATAPERKAYVRAVHAAHSLTTRGRAGVLRRNALSRARQKVIPFDLTNDWIQFQLDLGVCELSGLPFDFGPPKDGSTHPLAPSIDRIDTSEGYTSDNSRIILWCLNMGMGEWGESLALTVWHTVMARKSRQ